MPPKEIKTMAFKVNGVSLVSSVDVPELTLKGTQDATVMVISGKGTMATLSGVIPKRDMWRHKRYVQRELLGSNNWRKRHGLPMYRKWA